MLAYFLFFFYLFTGTILLHLIIRRYIFPFTIYHTASIVFFKVFLGCLYGWVFLHFYGGDDTWDYFNRSKMQTNLLLVHPLAFLDDLWPGHALEVTGNNGWEAIVYYIHQFEPWFVMKTLAVFNLLSGKNYYIDVLLFNFLTIAGPLLLFKMLAGLFPQKAGMNFLLIFFIPSIVFWCSGIRAEALIFLSIVLILYNSQEYAKYKRKRYIAGVFGGFLGLLLFRFQFIAVFTPFYIAYLISIYKKVSGPVYFSRAFIISGIIFMVSLLLPPSYQLSRPVQRAQLSFFELKGNTQYKLDSLQSGPVSFLKILPQAAANAVFRPYPWEGKNLLQSLSSIEVIFLIAGILFFMVSPRRKGQVSHPLYWLFLYYGICQIILIGYAVPFPGAIVRYRCILLLFLFLFLYAGNPLLQQKLRYRIFKLH
jgi:hypothetical protein